jgi:hypothetical protein
LNVKVARYWRKDIYVTSGCSNLEWLSLFALLVDVHQLTWLYTEGWAVDSLTIHKNVTVYDHLTCLCDGASEARTKHEGVETHFEKLNQVFTGKAFSALSLLESLAKLSLTDAVLGT